MSFFWKEQCYQKHFICKFKTENLKLIGFVESICGISKIVTLFNYNTSLLKQLVLKNENFPLK